MRLLVPVGIPGCGKSAWSRVIDHVNMRVVSSDAIREETTGDINDQTRNSDTFAIFHARIEDHLLDLLDVYADATNLDTRSRKSLRDIAERTRAEIHVIVFTNLNEAITRNQRRERMVPPEVMVRMLEKYEVALRDIISEPYDSVTYIESVV